MVAKKREGALTGYRVLDLTDSKAKTSEELVPQIPQR